MSDDDAKILSFPCGHPHETHASGAKLVNSAVVDMLEKFLGMAKNGDIISIGVAGVGPGGDAFENFSMAHAHALTFLGSVVIMEAIVRQNILANMTTSITRDQLKEEMSDRRDEPDEPSPERPDDPGDGGGEAPA